MTLFVDGVTYEPYLVTDDWPIHSSKIDTQLTVGACWQGQCMSERRFIYLKGAEQNKLESVRKLLRHSVVGIVDSCTLI